MKKISKKIEIFFTVWFDFFFLSNLSPKMYALAPGMSPSGTATASAVPQDIPSGLNYTPNTGYERTEPTEIMLSTQNQQQTRKMKQLDFNESKTTIKTTDGKVEDMSDIQQEKNG